MLIVVVVLVLVATVVTLVGASAIQVSRARGVADLSALAGARSVSNGGDGCAAAARTAIVNQARVRSCEVYGDDVTFVVSVVVELDRGARIPGLPAQVSARTDAGSADLIAPGGS